MKLGKFEVHTKTKDMPERVLSRERSGEAASVSGRAE